MDQAAIEARAQAILAGVKWEATKARREAQTSSLPFATHTGTVELFGRPVRCFRLNDGRAVFHGDDLEALVAYMLGH